MSQENVEFVEGLVAGAGEMDKQALLAALPDLIAQACDPDIEWVEDPQRADGQMHRGHEGVRQSWEQWLENWDEYRPRSSGSSTAAMTCLSSLASAGAE
jgi:hypothetical protein